MKNKITPALIGAVASGNLANVIAASTPGGIEHRERAGQIAQSFADTLPIEGTEGTMRPVWESIGFVFGSAVDDLFIGVTFPAGWRKQPSEHAMWTHLIDGKGYKRGSIFYKAAFYDRCATAHLNRRFSFSNQPVGGWQQATGKNERYIGVVRDCETIIFTTKPTDPEPSFKSGNEKSRLAWSKWLATRNSKEAEARKWLVEHYPDYENVTAYWDLT